MTAILDTSFLFALADQSDRNHQQALDLAQQTNEVLVLPVVVIPEICYLLASRLGHLAMRQFVASLATQAVKIESLSVKNLARVYEILDQYSDSQLDFTDAAIVAISEQLKITRVYTFDHRDFSMIRPRHCDYFELLP